MDSEGKRVAVKYYSDDWPTISAKSAFEKSVFTRTQKANARTEGMLKKAILLRAGVCGMRTHACACGSFMLAE